MSLPAIGFNARRISSSCSKESVLAIALAFTTYLVLDPYITYQYFLDAASFCCEWTRVTSRSNLTLLIVSPGGLIQLVHCHKSIIDQGFTTGDSWALLSSLGHGMQSCLNGHSTTLNYTWGETDTTPNVSYSFSKKIIKILGTAKGTLS